MPLQIPHGAPDNEAVRIFVEFTRLEAAIKGWKFKITMHLVDA